MHYVVYLESVRQRTTVWRHRQKIVHVYEFDVHVSSAADDNSAASPVCTFVMVYNVGQSDFGRRCFGDFPCVHIYFQCQLLEKTTVITI